MLLHSSAPHNHTARADACFPMAASKPGVSATPRIAALAICTLLICSGFVFFTPAAKRSQYHKLSQIDLPGPARHLLYTTVGADLAYILCLKWLVLSLNHHSPQPNFHFVIIVDNASKHLVEEHVPLHHLHFSTEFLVLDPEEVDRPGETPAVAASSRKLDIFRYEHLQRFTNIMYLDTDYLVTLDVSDILEKELQPGILYAHEETQYMMSYPPKEYPELHLQQWWGFQNYTKDDIAFFRKHKVLPFSAGCYMFNNTPDMMQIFKDMKKTMMTFKGKYYYEQSFLNYFFNTQLRSNTSLLSSYLLEYWAVAHAAGTYSFDNKLFHFVHAPQKGGAAKELLMREYYYREVLGRRREQTAILQSWLETLSAYALEALPKEKRAKWWKGMGHIGQVPRQVERYYRLAEDPSVKTICEIGFNAGHSAAVFMAAKPSASLYYFDMMSLPYSNRSMALFRTTYPNTFHFMKGSSFDSVPWLHKTQPGFQCDLFSVDGDHSYEGALTDFLNAIAMMKPGSVLVADDTSDRFAGCKKAFETISKAGYVKNVTCEGPAKYDLHAADVGVKRWCWGIVSTPKKKLSVPNAASSQTLQMDAV